MNCSQLRGYIRIGETAVTRTDVLSVLLVIAILALLALKSLATGSIHNDAAVCLNNFRRLTAAWVLYAEDNRGKLVGNLDGGNVTTVANSNRTWILGWLDYLDGTAFPPAFGGRADTNTFLPTQVSPLAAHHGRSAEVFKCPADESLSRGRTGAPRVRSVSMNGYVGYPNQAFTAGYRVFTTTYDLTSPGPSRTFVFVEEREDSINDGWFAVDMSGYSPYNPNVLIVVDYPAPYHDRATTFSFADGHAELKRWEDRRTIPMIRPGQILPLNVASPSNSDVMWMQARTTVSRRSELTSSGCPPDSW